MKQTFTLLAMVLFPAIAPAKCIELIYSFEGQVLAKSGKPAAGAFVGVSWLEHGQAAGPAVTVADIAGRYHLTVRFHPDDDIPLAGAACTDRVKSISIIAYAGNQRSYPKQVPVSDLKQQLPTVRIDEPANPR